MSDSLGELRVEDDGHGGIRFERVYDATPDEVWAALTEPDELRGWLAEVDSDPRVGGRIEVRFGTESTMNGTVQVFEPPHVLEYTWNEGKADAVLRFELETAPGGTRLVLDHRRLPGKGIEGFASGWHSHLALLGDKLEGGGADGTWAGIDAATKPVYVRTRPRYEQIVAQLFGSKEKESGRA
jgi:uncharacterized protein YndB with AHSA1/START domain